MIHLNFKRPKALVEGWNAASGGVQAHENPYPCVPTFTVDGPPPENAFLWRIAKAYSAELCGQTNYNLWLNGFADYMASPFNCIALKRYEIFKVEGDRNFILLEASVMEHDEIILCSYPDGSAVELTPLKVTVFGRNAKPFIQLEWDSAPEESSVQ